MDRPHRSDRSTRGLVRLRDWTAARRHRQDPESGQATVEFALILFPLLILVVGIIQFGIGLNYWLDMKRIANQGARWAAVNNWPAQCPRSTQVGYTCNNTPPTCAATLAAGSGQRCRTCFAALLASNHGHDLLPGRDLFDGPVRRSS